MNTPIVIPGYHFQQKTEENSTSVVWKAHQESLARDVSIKMLKPDLARDEKEVQAFLHEARAVAKLKSPRIMQVYDVGEQDGIPYMVMECSDGHPLSTLLDLGDPIAQKRALSIALSVAQGLSDAWTAEKLIHRNIKPANIFIEKGGKAKVANIGMSGLAADNAGYIVGTPSYISPEAAQASESVTFTTDMYSLGAVLYHMVTGRQPFADLDEEATLQAQVDGRLPFPQEINPAVTPPCAQLIARLMMKAPNMRYPDWPTAINDIAKLAAGKMIVAKPAAGMGSTIAAKGASRRKPIKKTSPAKKVVTKTGSPKQIVIPAATQPAASPATSRTPTPAPAPQATATTPAATADDTAARAAALKKKYRKPTTPGWIKWPLTAALMAFFGWLGFSLLWQPFREAYPPVEVVESDTPQTEPLPNPEQTEPLPIADQPEPAPQPAVEPPAPSTEPVEYAAEPYTSPEPDSTQPTATVSAEPEPEPSQLDAIARSLVDTAFSEGLDAAARALRQQPGANGELDALKSFFAPDNEPEAIIANNFKKHIGQETYVNIGGRRIDFRVEGVNDQTISTMVASSTGGSTVYRPAQLPISKLSVGEQRRLLGELDTPEKAFAAAKLDLSTANYADMISNSESCGPLADATRNFAQRRLDMLLE